MINKYTFPKSEKLCKFGYIQQLFSEGKSVQSYPLKMIYLPVNELDTKFQLLISVPKRNFKKAVFRNRIKRLIRENYRLEKHVFAEKIPQKLLLAIIFTGKELPDYQLINKKLVHCFEKLENEIFI